MACANMPGSLPLDRVGRCFKARLPSTYLPCVRREPILKPWYRGARSRRSIRRATYIDREPFD
eukprot:scaffold89468_cov80-Phaeocystis_antarctica.AAC.1